MGIPGADDIMLGYQSTSFHDVAWLRRVLGKRPAPEFEAWLERMGILSAAGLPVEEAVRKLCYLVENALVRRLSGVDLKDDVPPGYLPFAETRALG